jgi:polysaccharide deacetylase 2 family uncharacterized protein YibQ
MDLPPMAEQLKDPSRRNFLLKTAFFTAGSFIGTNHLLKPLARALSIGYDDDLDDFTHERPEIAIIIDDVGYNFSRVLPFLELGVPITFSILPRLMYSRRSAEKVHAEGHEIMLHQPMEPYSHLIDPGPGALYLSQGTKEMYKIIDENISSFPFSAGVNNHMGSRFTESREKVADTLKSFRERNFFFIDSITTHNSVAFNTARELNMTTAFRNVFIDNQWDKQYICLQLLKLKKHALKYGHAIGIGHPRPETVSALEEFLDELEGSSFSIVNASRIVYTKERKAALLPSESLRS